MTNGATGLEAKRVVTQGSLHWVDVVGLGKLPSEFCGCTDAIDIDQEGGANFDHLEENITVDNSSEWFGYDDHVQVCGNATQDGYQLKITFDSEITNPLFGFGTTVLNYHSAQDLWTLTSTSYPSDTNAPDVTAPYKYCTPDAGLARVRQGLAAFGESDEAADCRSAIALLVADLKRPEHVSQLMLDAAQYMGNDCVSSPNTTETATPPLDWVSVDGLGFMPEEFGFETTAINVFQPQRQGQNHWEENVSISAASQWFGSDTLSVYGSKTDTGYAIELTILSDAENPKFGKGITRLEFSTQEQLWTMSDTYPNDTGTPVVYGYCTPDEALVLTRRLLEVGASSPEGQVFAQAINLVTTQLRQPHMVAHVIAELPGYAGDECVIPNMSNLKYDYEDVGAEAGAYLGP